MAQIEGFNSEDFGRNLTTQAKEVIPEDISEEDKKFIGHILYRFCVLAGDALINDETVTINAQQASIICQFIGEWTFHKSIDLIRSGVPLDKRDPILQKVAFAVFEESRDVIVNNVEQNEAIGRVEQAVAYAYQAALEEMQNQNELDAELAQKAQQESNIDKMAEESEEELPENQAAAQAAQAENKSPQTTQQDPTVSPKLLKLAAVALLLKKLKSKNARKILGHFNERDFKAITSYMHLDGLEEVFDIKQLERYMHEFLMTIPEEAQEYHAQLARKKYTDLTKSVSEQELESLLGKERVKIKNTIYEPKNIKELPTKVSNIVYNYLNTKVNK